RTDGKHIVPTERGLALFGVLERADPALVDPGVTAQMELLLDQVLVGEQEMVGAIDAVCTQASRIIGRLTDGTTPGDAALVASAVGQPGRVSRRGRAAGEGAQRPPRLARRRKAKASAGPTEVAAGATGHTPPDRGAVGRSAAAAPQGRKGSPRPSRRTAGGPTRPGKRQQGGTAAEGDTPLRIPFGNKEVALQLGARY
ncbi:hypothetical protein Q7A36_40660, partial [Paracraurococcus sp. LOR1-02]|nr:hypothetical protein [Paracraurococcus sp. LOR1-02]